MAYEVQRMWEALYIKALNRSLMLESTKASFAKLIVNETDEFLKTIDGFVKRFEEEGPGSVGQDLDLGLVLMDVSQSFSFRKQEFLQSIS